jgi:hypothetical protein
MNWFAVTLMTIWVSSTVGAIFTRDSTIYIIALIATVIMGFGYAVLRQ